MAERGQARCFQVVAVEEVVGVEGDQAAVGVDYVDAGFLDAADIEGVGVDELHDDDAEDIFVGQGGGGEWARCARWTGECVRPHMTCAGFCICDPDFGEAAEEFAEGAGAASGRVIGGEEFEEIGADGGVLFVEDGVGGSVD